MRKIIVCILITLASCLLVSQDACALSVSAKAAVLMNAQTAAVIYSRNPDVKLPMASTTKIMTALILTENTKADNEVKITNEMVAVEGSNMGLKAGDTVTCGDLLYGLMLPSGNDAANAIAIHIAGDIKSFAKLMNKKAQQLGCINTKFVTPSGLDSDGHSTTAYDLALIARAAIESEVIRQAVSTDYKVVKTKEGRELPLSNHNKLLKLYDGAIGIKTGFTKAAGRCLVSAAKRGDTTLIAVTLNDKDDWNDHANMLDYGFSVCKSIEVNPQIPSYIQASQKDTLIEISTNKVVFSVAPNDKIIYKIFLPKFLFHEAVIGEEIGYVQFLSANREIARSPIKIADIEDFYRKEQSFFRKVIMRFNYMLGSF